MFKIVLNELASTNTVKVRLSVIKYELRRNRNDGSSLREKTTPCSSDGSNGIQVSVAINVSKCQKELRFFSREK